VAWMAVADGVVRNARDTVRAGEVAVFEDGSAPIDFVSDEPTRFVIGSAQRHPHDLVLGYYSVHTSAEALEKGEAEIARIGDELRAKGIVRA
jgi:hypothetical protein